MLDKLEEDQKQIQEELDAVRKAHSLKAAAAKEPSSL
jgi:hypothetical protein